ncbi:MAG TPA: hypothetical protein GX531_07365 [Methanothermobacter sp.]|nr:hypothetical protein [Methanothermobacter sp.]
MTMTTEQRNLERARKRLSEYKKAVKQLQYLADRIETLEVQVTRSTKPHDANAGWTGLFVGRSKYGKGKIVTDNSNEIDNPRMVMTLPKINPGTPDPKVGEKLLAGLIDYQLDYEKQALEALNVCRAIEREIDEACVGIWAVALKYRYLEDMSYRRIGQRMNYSATQIRRLIDEALWQYSEKMAQMAQNGAPTCDII